MGTEMNEAPLVDFETFKIEPGDTLLVRPKIQLGESQFLRFIKSARIQADKLNIPIMFMPHNVDVSVVRGEPELAVMEWSEE